VNYPARERGVIHHTRFSYELAHYPSPGPRFEDRRGVA